MAGNIFTVSDVSKYIATLLKRDPILSDINVEGEVSNFRKSSGNIYFSLKDETASINCIIFRNMEISKKLLLTDGDKISLRASVITYSKGGYYQLLVKEVINTGIGDIYKNYELLKEKLKNQGYFDNIHKKAIPKMPFNIGVITSPNGAAIRDIITTIKRRYKIANIYVYPAIVQGSNAPSSLIKGIELLDSKNFLDLIIIGRGGGSFEDLNCFNDEGLLNKIFEAKTPIVSAVGHEIDNMLSDFVSDLRAPTPTAAAELVTPDLLELQSMINKKLIQIEKAYYNYFIEERKKLSYYENIIRIYNPLEKIYKLKTEAEKFKVRIKRQQTLNIEKLREVLAVKKIRLDRYNPIEKITLVRNKLNNNIRIVEYKINSFMKQQRLQLNNYHTRMECHNDSRIKKLGYIRVSDKGTFITSKDKLKIGEVVKLHFQDGVALSEIRSIDNE